MSKLIVIVGVTGNQGGSVAQRFLLDPTYRVRGLTRNASSPAALALASQGIEIVSANLDSVSELTSAFAGANLIFSVTNYWEPFFRPDCRQRAAEAGISCRKFAYDVEFQQGKNIADAAAQTAETLDKNGFIASTLCHAENCSNGVYKELYHFDAKADVFPGYVKERHTELAEKMSCIQTGYFMTSYKLAPGAYFSKLPDGSFEMSFPCAPEAKVPHIDINADMGNFVYAVSQLPPGKSYMAEGETCSWSEYQRIWTRLHKIPTRYREVTVDQFVENSPDTEFGREAGEMWAYSTDPGYDGGDKTLLRAADIRKAGVECPMTSLEDFFKKADWSMILSQ